MRFVLSDASRDRMGDEIAPDGWRLDNFRRHPICLFGHDAKMPVGTWTDVKVEGGRLLGSLDLLPADSSPQTRLVHALMAHGAAAVSVGFRVIESEPLDPAAPWGAKRFLAAELVEASIVSVPANPNSLALGKAFGFHLEDPAMSEAATSLVPANLRTLPTPATHTRPPAEYSLAKLMRGMGGERGFDWDLERGISEELARRAEKKRSGAAYIPLVALARSAGLIQKATSASTVPFPAAAPGTPTAGALSNMARIDLLDPVLVGAAVEKLLRATQAGVRVITSDQRQVQIPAITGLPVTSIIALDAAIPLSDFPVKSTLVDPVEAALRVPFERSSWYAHGADEIASKLIVQSIKQKIDTAVFSKTAASGIQNGIIDIATAAVTTDVVDLASALALGREADIAAGGGEVNSAAFVMDPRAVIKLSSTLAFTGSQQSVMDALRASGRKIVEVNMPDVSAGKSYVLAGDFSSFALVLFGPALVVEANYWGDTLWSRGAHELRAILDFGLGAIYAPAILKSAVATTLTAAPFLIEATEATTETTAARRSRS